MDRDHDAALISQDKRPVAVLQGLKAGGWSLICHRFTGCRP
jgi:hypothetical protein